MIGTFGRARAAKMAQASKETAGIPRREVPVAEFVKLATAVGMEDPEFAARVCAATGAYVLVGGELLRVTQEAQA